MPKWIVMSKPHPIKVIVVGAVIGVVIVVTLELILHRLGVRYHNVIAIAFGYLVAILYLGSRPREPKDKQP
jgi:hypothetical protein